MGFSCLFVCLIIIFGICGICGYSQFKKKISTTSSSFTCGGNNLPATSNPIFEKDFEQSQGVVFVNAPPSYFDEQPMAMVCVRTKADKIILSAYNYVYVAKIYYA